MDLPWSTEREFYELHSKELFSRYSFYHATMVGNTNEEFAQYIIDRLKLKPSDKVVDLGCGSGFLVHEISKVCDCTGISTSETCIEQCRINFPETKFELGNMESYKLENATHYIELEAIGYADMAKTFKNAFDNLSSGGIFYIKDVFYHYNENYKQKANRIYWENYFKYKIDNVANFTELGYQAGFELVEFKDISDIVNLKIFNESLQLNLVKFEYPYPEVFCHIAGEFIFRKK